MQEKLEKWSFPVRIMYIQKLRQMYIVKIEDHKDLVLVHRFRLSYIRWSLLLECLRFVCQKGVQIAVQTQFTETGTE